MNGLPLPLAVMITIPQPWRNDKNISREKRDFYHYYSTMMEPWDGPRGHMFSDGDQVGAVLDRNGLRPARYYITKDQRLILSSEVGVLEIPESEILQKSRLEPGKMLLVDLKEKRIVSDEECKEYFAMRKPYGEWLDQQLVRLRDLPIPNCRIPSCSQEERDKLYKCFGYNYEDIKDSILPMAKNGTEAFSSMGDGYPAGGTQREASKLISILLNRILLR